MHITEILYFHAPLSEHAPVVECTGTPEVTGKIYEIDAPAIFYFFLKMCSFFLLCRRIHQKAQTYSIELMKNKQLMKGRFIHRKEGLSPWQSKSRYPSLLRTSCCYC